MVARIGYHRYDLQLKIKSFSFNSYRGMLPNKQILCDYAENCAILCPHANYESSLRIFVIMDNVDRRT